jgi:tRNA(fMet)-specific endonuclease VapC
VYLLDTNIWSHLLRRTSQRLLTRYAAASTAQIHLSVVVRGELELGFMKGDRAAPRRQALDLLMQGSTPLTMSQEVALRYAELRSQLEGTGNTIGPNDMWIAAEALHHGLTVVTDNTREFERVAGLNVENWL